MIRRILPALVIVFLTGLIALPAPPALESDTLDLIYLADGRPILMRIDLNSDGKSLDVRWRRFVDLLLVYLDKNNDESLDDKELWNLPPILSFLTGGREAIPLPKDRGTGVFREQLANHLRGNGYQPFRLPSSPTELSAPRTIRMVSSAPMASPTEIDKAIMALMDTNKDGKLSADELTAAQSVLQKLDANDDEQISLAELLRTPESSPFGFQQSVTMDAGPPATFDLLQINRTGSNTDLAKRIMRKYYSEPKTKTEPEPKKQLSREKIGLPAEAFAVLDRNKDGLLDADELTRIASCPPDRSLVVNLGKIASGKMVIDGKPIKKGKGKEPADSGPIMIDTPGLMLNFATSSTMSYQNADGYVNNLVNLFTNADRDGNGYVDKTEAQQFPQLNAAFELIDADHDEKLFVAEVRTFAEEVADLVTATEAGFASVTVTDQGKGLFGLFDGDNDGVLSPREQKHLVKTLDGDRNKDSLLEPVEIPKQKIISFNRGYPQSQVPNGDFFAVSTQPTRLRKVDGPRWFRKMDRNEDGDVSRREFLGTDEDFRKIDKDGDGLIDAKEAAEALFRKGP